MRKIKFILSTLAVIGTLLVIYFVLGSKYALVTQPKGAIAHSQLELITTNTILMLLILVPTLVVLLVVSWKYRSTNKRTKYDPNASQGRFTQVILWILPSIIVAPMALITWKATHKLDPYKPLESEIKPLIIQVVALNWKWLFIYPEQSIATVNFVQFPEKTPIQFALCADASPMNSFWIPQLSGQIYAMTGMITRLHIMADGPGEYSGKAAEINGDGYAGMNFVAKSSSKNDFDDWIAHVKKSPLKLNESSYNELIQFSQNNPIAIYSNVEEDLFNKIVMKYMSH